ncbi:MAG: transglycosylase SLT domain-containing protein [Methylococcales bacterium]|nr:transglycosylase SLT domain-containing protein [Methylococcales bacterium]
MRLLLLISTLAIGTSLLTHPNDASAAKAAKNNHANGRTTAHGKGNRHSKHIEVNPGDVWRRIGSGLRIPRPSMAQLITIEPITPNQIEPATLPPRGAISSEVIPNPTALPALEPQAQSVESVKAVRLIEPAAITPPEDNYTARGRKLLAKIPSETTEGCEAKKNLVAKLRSATALKTRIRTQLNVRPNLHGRINSPEEIVAYNALVAHEDAQNVPCENTVVQKMADVIPQADTVPQAPAPVMDAETSAARLFENQQMQLLANQQRELAMQKNAKLLINIERVSKYVDWYAQRRLYLSEVAERAQPYLYHIVEGLNRHKLPLDLALLPIVESAYQPTAKSPMSAAGLWQFMPMTGQDYNLKQDSHYDDRLDITASTQAALSYLGFLNQHFKGDWLLALAAYNCGIGRVDAAINRNITDGLDTDYWSLQLPEETQEYVPRFLALATLFANPANYNLKLTPVRNELYFITVNVDRKPDLKNVANKDIKTIAQLANISDAQFSLLNPGYLETSLPPDRPLSFLMPIPNANQLYQQLTTLATIETNVQKTEQPFYARVSLQGESVGLPFSTFDAPFLVLNVDKPVLPEVIKEAVVEHNQPKQANDAYLTAHYIDKGETLQTVAKHFEVSVEALRDINKLKRKQGVVLGQRLIIPPKKITVMLAAAL